MPSLVQAELIRQQVKETFAELGAAPEEEVRESLLIRGGFFCGRRFQLDGLSAVWFMEENELKFYDRDGKPASIVRPSMAAQPNAPAEVRRAA